MRIIAVSTGLALLAGGLAFAPPAYAAAGSTLTIKVAAPPAFIGDEVTVTGKLTSGGKALADRDVLVDVAGKRQIVETNGQGLYIAELRVPRSGAFTADFFGDSSYNESTAATPFYNVVYRTGIDGFGAQPRPVAQNKPVNITGRLYRSGLAGREALSGARLDLLFSPDGQNWSYVASAATDGKGKFRFAPTVAQDGTWLVTLPANSAADGWAATEKKIWVDSRYPTRLSASATPKKVKYKGKVRVYGSLGHKVDGLWAALGRVHVAVYFRAKGSSKWRFKDDAWVGADGRYGKKFTATRDGYWRTVYKGTGADFRVTSGKTYVDVR
ncbi:hypothetical protein EDD29_8388 [Actinocorallia herbida]|uniref:Ig-like domain-containing protein n=1 Tax=Actinocorallia herbida TaxID=58109 RepID=A0A3N1DAU9_9ACTN|nr:hypothetical protein [Actinocorallia herbida]ROO90653.1 hypothetical protein EDD29_8388 [Actinocorallia herbida]